MSFAELGGSQHWERRFKIFDAHFQVEKNDVQTLQNPVKMLSPMLSSLFYPCLIVKHITHFDRVIQQDSIRLFKKNATKAVSEYYPGCELCLMKNN